MKCIFGVDIGGTQIKIGKFVEDKLILKWAIDTNISDNGKYILHNICENIQKNLDNDELIGIGIGVPGPVLDGVVLGAQNIGWKEIDVKKEMTKAFPKVYIKVLNDANAACLGEVFKNDFYFYKNVVMLTLGTGLGGGLIINNKIYEGSSGSSGELGHICIENNGRDCTCGLKGCLEQYVSATGIVRTALEKRKHQNTLLNKNDLTCKEIFDFAKNGDKIAQEVVEDMSEKLALGCANICNILNPDLVIIGGGVSKAGPYLLEKVEKKFLKYAFYSVRDTKFALAKLGNDAGIYGCYYEIRGMLI